jgi:hypothetical protein
VIKGDGQACRRDLEVQREKGITEIVAILQNQAAPPDTLRCRGARNPGELNLFERKAGRPAGRNSDQIRITVEYIIQLTAASARRSARIVYDQVVDLCRVMRVGKIGLADNDCVAGSIGVDE